MIKRGEKKITIKQKKFIDRYIETGNATQAAFEVFNVKSRHNAKILGWNYLQKPKVKKEVERLMEKHEVTDEFLMQRLREGLDAKVVSNYKGETEQTDIKDLNVRHKYWQEAAKLREMYPAQKVETKNVNIDVQLETLSSKEVIKLLAKEINELKKYEQENRQEKISKEDTRELESSTSRNRNQFRNIIKEKDNSTTGTNEGVRNSS